MNARSVDLARGDVGELIEEAQVHGWDGGVTAPPQGRLRFLGPQKVLARCQRLAGTQDIPARRKGRREYGTVSTLTTAGP
ncbi:hypothetical protein [Streptomyces sp. NPDC060031]|uniref:hypothetical protein n=1 Tax=Streptomyces sp. NPDC060031 TaxID=3347043 RepID=UPI0036BEEF85